MGLYNVLHAYWKCPQCGFESKQAIQFKHGDRYMNEYELGDNLLWTSEEDFRSQGLVETVRGIVPPCMKCKRDWFGVMIRIRDNKLVGVEVEPPA